MPSICYCLRKAAPRRNVVDSGVQDQEKKLGIEPCKTTTSHLRHRRGMEKGKRSKAKQRCWRAERSLEKGLKVRMERDQVDLWTVISPLPFPLVD